MGGFDVPSVIREVAAPSKLCIVLELSEDLRYCFIHGSFMLKYGSHGQLVVDVLAWLIVGSTN